MVQVLDKTFDVYIKAEEIQKKVDLLASQINDDFGGRDIIFIAVLNGAFMFASDLMKKVNIQSEISFVKMSSYHGTASTGRIDELIGLNNNLKDKTVVVIEDIVDSGLTIDKIISLIKMEEPREVQICTLLYKPEAFKGKNEPKYVGFSIPNAFVVGYGLDYNQKGRNLNAIYQIKTND